MRKSRTVAVYGLLIALAFVLSYVESFIPPLMAIPGMKLGLTNIVVLMALYCMDRRSALIINVVRILLVSFVFGNGVSLLFSLAGGVLSCVVMILLKRTDRFRIVTVSILGGICHNLGQILVAMVLLQTSSLAWYLLILWCTGILAGLIIGLIGGELCRRLKKILGKKE